MAPALHFCGKRVLMVTGSVQRGADFRKQASGSTHFDDRFQISRDFQNEGVIGTEIMVDPMTNDKG